MRGLTIYLHEQRTCMTASTRVVLGPSSDLTQPLLNEVPVRSQESGRSCICVLRVSNLPFFAILIFNFEIVDMFVCYKLYCTLEEKIHFSVVLRCSVRLYLQFFIGKLMSYLRYLSLLTHGGVQHISLLCYDFLFVFTSSSLQASSCLIFVICLCLRMVVSKIFLCCVTIFCSSTSSSVYEVSCLSFVICLCLRMLVSNTFLSCLPMVGGSIRDSGFFHH